MDLIQINLACQTKKNLTETKKELEKYVNDATSYEAISLAYIFLKKADCFLHGLKHRQFSLLLFLQE